MRHAEWYMTADPSARIVAYQWWPADTAAPLEPMSEGTVYFTKREAPGAVWEAPVTIGPMVLAVARQLAAGQGFTHEEVAA